MTKVKICGITNLEDALLSAKFGADALGFNFYPKSPRYISPQQAREIIEQLPKEVLKVGVFVNEDFEKISGIAVAVKLDAIQLHGEETPEFASKLKVKTNLEVIKAFSVSPEFKPEDVLRFEVDAVLLDAYSPKEHGGTGETFDWEIALKVRQLTPKLYLAGGLASDNIKTAIRRVQPFAVDSCSLLEKEKGKKDKFKISSFIISAKDNYKDFQIGSIYDLLLLIELRPALYLGVRSISNLFMFLWGIEFGLNKISLESSDFDWKQFKPNKEPRYEYGFQAWIFEKYKSNRESSQFWSDIILRQVANDEEKALELFFTL
jgi:phosphoribosylanthranilate isomerase